MIPLSENVKSIKRKSLFSIKNCLENEKYQSNKGKYDQSVRNDA